MEYYVAKSYQEWARECEPFEANGKMYVIVRKPTGTTKQVRAYTETEYCKMYPKDTCGSPVPQNGTTAPAQNGPVVKNILGFQEGYIWIFKGDLDNADYWFEKTPECRFHTRFGWYIVSTESIPFDIPSCIESVKLPWEKIGRADGTLLPKDIVQAAIDELRFGNQPSQFQGSIGDRLDLTVYLRRVIDLGENQFGSSSRIYCFEDSAANQYSWTTGVNKDWLINDELHIRGTVKEHSTVKGVRFTLLTRVMEVKK